MATLKILLMTVFTLVFQLISSSAMSAPIVEFKTGVSSVGAYGKDTAYSNEQCIIILESDTQTSCGDTRKAIINLNKVVGQMMCSVALTAFTTNKRIAIWSSDDCDTLHKAPIVRYLQIIN